MSDAILLWWGRDLYLYNAGNLTHQSMAERADAVGVIQTTLANLSPKPKGVRVIYQPSDLESRTENCPKGSRSMLRKTLGVDIAALQNQELAWAALEPKPIAEGSYATLVFNESRPRLNRIASTLATKGISLVGAWPLARVIEAQMSASGAESNGIGIVCVDDHVMVYSCNPVGERDASIHDGVEAREISLTDLRRATSQFDDSRATVVQVGHGDPWNIADVLGESPVTTVTLSDFMRGVESLKTEELASFTASEAVIAPATIAKAASVILLLAAGVFGFMGFDARRIATAEFNQLAKSRNDLKAEIAHLTQNKQQMADLSGYMSEAHLETLYRGQFLETVSRSCPPAITLTMIRISEQGFVVAGNSAEGIGQKTGPFFTLLDNLTNPQKKLWTVPVESRPDVLQNPEFSVNGRFTVQAPILKSVNN